MLERDRERCTDRNINETGGGCKERNVHMKKRETQIEIYMQEREMYR